MRMFGKRAVLLACLVLWAALATGCSVDLSRTRVIFTTGFGQDEVFRIGTAGCSRAEILVYLVNAQNRYESVYGSQVWKIARDGVTLEENVKEMVLARVSQIKAMCLLAESKGLSLEEEEKARVSQAAAEYFHSLSDVEKQLLGVDEAVIESMYSEYALADKVYRYIIRDVNPEISDDEARTITIQHILLQTWTVDGKGSRVTYNEELKREVYERACEIRRQAVEDEADFVDLASRYSDDNVITYSFGKGEMEAVFEETAFGLETNEVSQVIENEEGYHIIKCITTFDREQTDLNKLEIVEERRREVFGQEYDAFIEKQAQLLNTELWKKIGLIHDVETHTADFMDVYRKYMETDSF